MHTNIKAAVLFRPSPGTAPAEWQKKARRKGGRGRGWRVRSTARRVAGGPALMDEPRNP
jgi:hypothetical protein